MEIQEEIKKLEILFAENEAELAKLQSEQAQLMNTIKILKAGNPPPYPQEAIDIMKYCSDRIAERKARKRNEGLPG